MLFRSEPVDQAHAQARVPGRDGRGGAVGGAGGVEPAVRPRRQEGPPAVPGGSDASRALPAATVGASGFLYTLAYSKTNQSGTDQPENSKPVLGAAAAALGDWIDISGITEGAIFRRIRKGGHLGEALSPAAVRAVVMERCALAGIDGDFSAHSLRSGFVTEAGRQNVPLAETMAMTGHRSVATVLGYFRSESTLTSGAARLLE